MFDLMYYFSDWLAQFTNFAPFPFSPEKTTAEYLYSLESTQVLSVYLLWSILLLIFIGFCFILFKYLVYSILQVINN